MSSQELCTCFVSVCIAGKIEVKVLTKVLKYQHETIRRFLSAAHFEINFVYFNRFLCYGFKVLGVVQSAKCLVLRKLTNVLNPRYHQELKAQASVSVAYQWERILGFLENVPS